MRPKREYKVLIVNSAILQSEIGNYLCSSGALTKENAAFVALWHYSYHANETHVSLRTNRKDVDLSIIAPNLGGNGGGGHADAAAFSFKGTGICNYFQRKPTMSPK